MADRDVEVDVVARDKTSKGIQSAEKGFARLGKSSKQGVDQWTSGFKRLGQATSRWSNSGDSAGKKFVRGIGKGIGKVAELGGAVGGGLSKAVSAAGPQVSLALAGVLAAAALAAAPALGAVIAGAMVGGAALGGIVGGVMIASKDARVRGAFDALGEEVGADLQKAAGRFVPATLEATKEARKSFKSLLPDLKRIFDISATWLPGLTRSVGRGAEFALAGITKAVTKAGPIVTQIGKGIEGILAAVGKVFGDLSDNGNSMALALKGALGLVKLTILGVGGALNLLVEAFEFFVNKIPGGKRLLESMTDSQDGAKTSALNLGGGFQALAGDANAAAAGLTNAKQKADELVDSNIGLARAQLGSRDAARQAADAIKENSKAKLSNSQRADANKGALLTLAEAFNQETTAGEKSKISAGKAAAAYSSNRDALIKMAEKAGYSRTEAEKLAAQMLKMPKGVDIPVNVSTAKAAGQLETFMKKVRKADGTVARVTVQVTSSGDHRIPGVGTQLRRWGGIDYAMARGGAIDAHFTRSPTVLYGERETGGEAFIPKRGDLGRSRGIAETVVRDWLGGDVQWGGQAAGGATAPMVLEAHIEIGGEVVRVVQVQLKERDRALKRRVGAGPRAAR